MNGRRTQLAVLLFAAASILTSSPGLGQELDAKYEYLSRDEEFYTQRLICAAYYGIEGRGHGTDTGIYQRFKLFRNMAAADYMRAAQNGFGGLYPSTSTTPSRADAAEAEQYTDRQILVIVRTLDSEPGATAGFDRGCGILFERYKFLLDP
jgi:hypothetical protein